MVTVARPSRSDSLSMGLMWASRVTSLAFGFALPPTLGAWIDNRYGSSPVGILIGVGFGVLSGFLQILRIVQAGPGPRKS